MTKHKLKRVALIVTANGYAIETGPYHGASDQLERTYVFESMDSLQEFLESNLEVPEQD